MASSASSSSLFSSLVFLAAAILAAVHLPSSAHAGDLFQNCTTTDPELGIVAITSLETQPKPAKTDNDFTVRIVATTASIDLRSFEAVSVVYGILDSSNGTTEPLPLFSTEKTLCKSDACPDQNQVFKVDNTFRLPSTIVPNAYQLRVSMTTPDMPHHELTCINSDLTVE